MAVERNLDIVDKKIHEWTSMSGAVTPIGKVEILQVCRRSNCSCERRIGNEDSRFGLL